MRAAWYDHNGAAGEVLTVGELPDPEPRVGEVRVGIEAAGINPADVKRRSGAGGRAMTHDRVIPGDDGAGVIDRVGPRVPTARIGQRVWIHSANHTSAFGANLPLTSAVIATGGNHRRLRLRRRPRTGAALLPTHAPHRHDPHRPGLRHAGRSIGKVLLTVP
ncbi:alcohol dehydrogenase catalytic domain-containing protein [Catenulispora sp. NF23]|uniref:alcohol dehydrogenase catalytic domain-containing protein n=1 Tax=Catenulispora pinistramenti TaxID=2705254 RepID=UPI001BA7175D|nr:alcohol dehydrogenase catalytic domain-containing protein [Catenulispora pinistramenti]MBS2533820.1 alcohol dehydrogenase catalytic domain-containing protein [Catenulispora pinistramenti]